MKPADTFGEMLDTTPEARDRYYALLRALTPQQRARAISSASRSIRTLAEAGLRHEYPGASAEEIRIRLTVRLYGRDAALRLHGEVPRTHDNDDGAPHRWSAPSDFSFA